MKIFKGSDGMIDSDPEPGSKTDTSTPAGIANDFCRPGIRDECAELLHGLNNALVSMLLNAQVMEWKLPSYSRLKRNLHEIERNAQRGGELVKRLLQRLDAAKPEDLNATPVGSDMPTLSGAVLAMAEQMLDAGIPMQESPSRPPQRAVPAGSPCRKKVPHTRV